MNLRLRCPNGQFTLKGVSGDKTWVLHLSYYYSFFRFLSFKPFPILSHNFKKDEFRQLIQEQSGIPPQNQKSK